MLTQAFSLRLERIFSPVRGTCREKETKSAARRRRRESWTSVVGRWEAEGLVETPQGKIRISNLIFQGIFNSVPTPIPHHRQLLLSRPSSVISLLFHRSFSLSIYLSNNEKSNNLRFNLNVYSSPSLLILVILPYQLERNSIRNSSKE